MTIEELKKHKKILIVGYGVEGKSVEAFLKKHCPGVEIGIADISSGNDYLDKQHDYSLAIKSPGVRPEVIKIPYTTATNIFFANKKGKIIGVTGTKGKSTTATLIYLFLRGLTENVYLGGNIGKPALELLDNLNDQSWAVLELSSFQLQDIVWSPHIAVVLMITSEHLDFHKDVEEYVDAKRNIVRFQTAEDYAIVNRDYPASNETDVHTPGQLFYVSRERETTNACYAMNGVIAIKKNESINEIIKVSEVSLLGKHNLENICAAVMTANIAGVSTKHIKEVLQSFNGLEHRLEYIAEKRGIRFYNDSLATNPFATIEALDTFGEKAETLIAGGQDRKTDYTELGVALTKSEVKTLILFPDTGKKIWEAVVAAGGEHRIKKYDAHSMHEAVVLAADETSAGKVCLLSPAAPSFGLFKNYQDRGEQFKKEVLALEEQ